MKLRDAYIYYVDSGECNESGIVVREEEQDGEKNEEGQPELCAEEKQQNVQVCFCCVPVKCIYLRIGCQF